MGLYQVCAVLGIIGIQQLVSLKSKLYTDLTYMNPFNNNLHYFDLLATTLTIHVTGSVNRCIKLESAS